MFDELTGFADLLATALEGDPPVADPFRLFQIAMATGVAAATAHHGLVHYMAIPPDHPALTGTTSFVSGEEKWRAINQENFDAIGEAVLGLGSKLLGLSSVVDIRDRDKKQWIDSYFPTGKSLWWWGFVEHYEPGRFEIHARRLFRSSVAIDDRDDAYVHTLRDGRTRTARPTGRIDHEFYLSSAEATDVVIAKGRHGVDRLWKVYELVASRLARTGGSIGDLLSPDAPAFFAVLIDREERHRGEVARNAREREARSQNIGGDRAGSR